MARLKELQVNWNHHLCRIEHRLSIGGQSQSLSNRQRLTASGNGLSRGNPIDRNGLPRRNSIERNGLPRGNSIERNGFPRQYSIEEKKK